MWTLILLVHVGIWGKGDSNSLTNVIGFKSKEACEAAGRLTPALVSGTKKESVFVCVEIK